MIDRLRADIFFFALFAIAAILPFAARADGDCPAGYHQTGEQDEHQGNTTITHAVCAPDEESASSPIPSSRPAMSCAAAQQRASQLRASMEKQRGLSEMNQEQLKEWTERGSEGRNELVKDSVKLVAGEYAADSEMVQEEAGKLEDAARAYASRSFGNKYNASRMANLAALKQKLSEMDAMNGLVRAKTIFNPDTITAWEVSRDSMHNAFRTAAATNSSFAKLVNDPKFRSDLLGSPDSDPKRELLRTALSETSQLIAKRALGLAKYEAFTGPTVRIADFVFNAALDDLKIYLSADRVDQANTNAGVLARQAGVVQKKYEMVIDRLRQCRSKP
jgi:hypothetical protein